MTFLEKLTAILDNNWCATQGEAVFLFEARRSLRDIPEDQWGWQLKALIDGRCLGRKGEHGEASAIDSIDRNVPTVVVT